VPEAEVDQAAVQRAVENASLAGLVASLPAGLSSTVGERGVALSGGERQRIGIARALYNDPAVLILDEATSALDAGTEAAIRETLSHLHGRKTIVIIAHRASMVKDCDRLILLKDGRIAAEGTFHDLFASMGAFAAG
jgi:ABC-type multidrug transport system fused ATPase/permease subunit